VICSLLPIVCQQSAVSSQAAAASDACIHAFSVCCSACSCPVLVLSHPLLSSCPRVVPHSSQAARRTRHPLTPAREVRHGHAHVMQQLHTLPPMAAMMVLLTSMHVSAISCRQLLAYQTQGAATTLCCDTHIAVVLPASMLDELESTTIS
jgi:hypothetical protein